LVLLLVAILHLSEVDGSMSAPLASDEERATIFNKWIADNYETKLYLEVRPTPGMRFGAFALRDIKMGRVYSSTPPQLLMGREALQRSDRTTYLQLDINGALLLFLLYEKNKGPDSFWFPYIQLLPTMNDYQHLPSYWPDADLKKGLSGTVCYQNVVGARHGEQKEYEKLKSFLEKHDRVALEYFDWDNFKWARTVRDSRTIWLEGKERQFVPMLDMINCKHHEDPSKIHLTRYGPKKSADTVALWNFKRGEQIWENYGQNNLMYYQFHGFTIQDNVYDCYDLNLESLYYYVDRWARRNGRHFRQVHFCISVRKGIPPDVMNFFAAVAADRANRNELDELDGIRGFEKHLKEKLQGLRLGKTTKWEATKDWIPTVSVDGWMAAREYRRSETRMVKELLRWARDRRLALKAQAEDDEL